MLSAVQTPGLTDLIFGLIAYGTLFAITIRLYRRNRAVILGVATVSIFFGFLLFAMLDHQHSPSWMLALVAILIILAGLFVLGFVAVDMFHWAKGKTKSVSVADDLKTGSRPGAK